MYTKTHTHTHPNLPHAYNSTLHIQSMHTISLYTECFFFLYFSFDLKMEKNANDNDTLQSCVSPFFYPPNISRCSPCLTVFFLMLKLKRKIEELSVYSIWIFPSIYFFRLYSYTVSFSLSLFVCAYTLGQFIGFAFTLALCVYFVVFLYHSLPLYVFTYIHHFLVFHFRFRIARFCIECTHVCVKYVNHTRMNWRDRIYFGVNRHETEQEGNKSEPKRDMKENNILLFTS